MKRTPFVVLEGIEGAGKSTQAQMLAQWLTEQGIEHFMGREPGGTPVGEAIREVVLNRRDLDLPPESELFLMLAARAAYVRDVVRPALAAGQLMVSDRYSMSTFAYQGFGRALALEPLIQANAVATGGLEPDATFLFEIPVEEGLGRRMGAAGELDRIETEGVHFLTRVADGYNTLAQDNPAVERIDATRGPTEVHKTLITALQRRFPETFGDGAVADEESESR